MIVRFTLLLLLALPASASAMEIAMQDDQTVLYGHHSREVALYQFKKMGGTHVRMNVEHRRNRRYRHDVTFRSRPRMHLVDNAVKAIRDSGLTPQVTLIWKDQEDPVYLAAWMRAVVTHLGNKVNRYAVLNEPDLLLNVGYRRCHTRAGLRRIVRRFPSRVLFAKGKWRATGVLLPGYNVNLQKACTKHFRGIRYRLLFNEAAKAIHKANPRAKILAGETSAQPGLDWFVRSTKRRGGLPFADGWAHHPFQLHDTTPGRRANGWGIGNLQQIRRLVDMPLYLTEFGYPHPRSTMDKRALGRHLTYSEVARMLERAWRLAWNGGARQMTQYQWFRKPRWRKEYWETALLRDDDGSLTPAYKALRALVRSWR